MLNPGSYTLCNQALGAAATIALTPILDLQGILSCAISARFYYTSGGTTAKAYIQTTFDDGVTWFDIACIAFTTAAGTKVMNLSALTPVLNAVAATDGALADNTAIDGLLGSQMRVKIINTGTYVSSIITVRIDAK